MHEAKTHLSRIVEHVARGESVLIAKAGKPMAILSPYTPVNKIRKPGALKGKIHIAADIDRTVKFTTNLIHDESNKD